VTLLVRLIAAWMGLNALVFALLATHAASMGGTWRYWWVRPGAALFLFALAAFGGTAAFKLWTLRLEGRRLASTFFAVLVLLYAVKLITGPDRGGVMLPLGLSVLTLSTLAGISRTSPVWRLGPPGPGAQAERPASE
jgi:hypothetical protein